MPLSEKSLWQKNLFQDQPGRRPDGAAAVCCAENVTARHASLDVLLKKSLTTSRVCTTATATSSSTSSLFSKLIFTKHGGSSSSGTVGHADQETSSAQTTAATALSHLSLNRSIDAAPAPPMDIDLSAVAYSSARTGRLFQVTRRDACSLSDTLGSAIDRPKKIVSLLAAQNKQLRLELTAVFAAAADVKLGQNQLRRLRLDCNARQLRVRPFDFAQPSPDEVILARQRAVFDANKPRYGPQFLNSN